jgi:hypothetical protein
VLARLIPAALVLALLLPGCGGDGGPSRRELVADYVKDVNIVQQELTAPRLAISNASRDLAQPVGDPAAVEAKLRRAARTIDRLRHRLAALQAPADAGRLRSLMLELLEREAALAREVAALAVFIPAFESTLRPLGAAGAKLKTALSAETSVDEKAAALEAYSAELGRVLRRLRPLRPPPVSAPAFESQVTTLERTRASTSALARALREKRSEDLPELLRRFDRAAVSNQSLAAQRARIQAVRAYNARVRGLDTLVIRMQRERLRLQNELE